MRTSRKPPKRGKKFRAGQEVRSIYEPERSFRIDKSIQPERLFHEKDTDRWFTRNELLALRDAKSIPVRVGAKSLTAIGKMRSLAFRGISGKQLASGVAKRPETRKCLECERDFTPTRKRQKFCSDAHRTAFWKRRNLSQVESAAGGSAHSDGEAILRINR